MTGLSGQAEISDDKQSRAEHFNGSVANILTPVSITSTTSDKIQLALIRNPNKGVNKNLNINDVIYANIDGSTNYFSIARGEMVYLAGNFDILKINASSNGVKYEIIIWS